MNENSRGDFAERRRQADWVIKAASVLSFISWLVAITVVFVLDLAAPENDNFFTRTWEGAALRTTWNETLLPAVFILLMVSLLSCIAAFFFNRIRMRRKTDKFKKSILIIGALTLAGLILFVFRFGGYMF